MGAVLVAPQTVQVNVRTPGSFSVGAVVTLPASHLCVCAPVAGMTSVLTSPQTVQV